METKLSYEEQIERLKYYGVRFDMMSEDEAKQFLWGNTYYAKLRSYLNSFEKYSDEARAHRCVHVDFKQLIELSRMDMHLRKFIISMSLDLEHSIKSFFVQVLTDDDDLDEYEIVQEYAGYRTGDFDSLIRIAKQSDYSYLAADRFEKSQNVWNLIELLTFNDFIQLFELYSKSNNHEYAFECELMKAARWLRNASAHNNSLLHNLNPQANEYHFVKSGHLITYLSERLGLNNPVVNRIISVPVLHDLAASLILLVQYGSPGIIEYRLKDFENFLNYCKSRAQVYHKQQNLLKQYESMRLLLDRLKETTQETTPLFL